MQNFILLTWNMLFSFGVLPTGQTYKIGEGTSQDN